MCTRNTNLDTNAVTIAVCCIMTIAPTTTTVDTAFREIIIYKCTTCPASSPTQTATTIANTVAIITTNNNINFIIAIAVTNFSSAPALSLSSSMSCQHFHCERCPQWPESSAFLSISEACPCPANVK